MLLTRKEIQLRQLERDLVELDKDIIFKVSELISKASMAGNEYINIDILKMPTKKRNYLKKYLELKGYYLRYSVYDDGIPAVLEVSWVIFK